MLYPVSEPRRVMPAATSASKQCWLVGSRYRCLATCEGCSSFRALSLFSSISIGNPQWFQYPGCSTQQTNAPPVVDGTSNPLQKTRRRGMQGTQGKGTPTCSSDAR
jgi:hypothetical protein